MRALLLGLLMLLASNTASSTAAASAPAAGVAAVPPVQRLTALLTPHTARDAPGRASTSVRAISSQRPITGERTVLPVVGQATDAEGLRWLRVRLPGRPNGATGWIIRTGTTMRATRWHVVVKLSRREVVVYRWGRAVRRFPAVVGKPSTPTPQGEFFVEEAVALPAGEAGAPFALALSARSNVLQVFDGGPGQIAIHGLAHIGGTPGTAVSHGCVRLTATALTWLVARIGPGVPISITS
jgi:lipoprotein-anchoring transpeptidase ErfK/SrfK